MLDMRKFAVVIVMAFKHANASCAIQMPNFGLHGGSDVFGGSIGGVD